MFKYAFVFFLPTITAPNIYYVTPENEAAYNTSINKNGFTLNYYINHSSEYISSNTQMYFLPGLFSLHLNFTITNVNNFSLIGYGKKSVIQCSTSSGIIIYNSTNITVQGFMLRMCATHASQRISKTSSLSLLYCSNVSISHLITDCLVNNYGILAINTFGISTIHNITSNRIKIICSLKKIPFNATHLTLSYFKRITSNCSSKTYAIEITLKNYKSNMKINLTYMTFNRRNSIFINIVTYDGVSSVYIRKVSFINITQPKGGSAIYIILVNHSKRIYAHANKILFTFCHFININALSYLILVKSYQHGYVYSEVSISKSSFHRITYAIILATKTSIESVQKPKLLVYFRCVKLNSVNHVKHVMYLEDTSLQLQEQVFTNINCNDSVIETKNSQVLFNQYIEFFNDQCKMVHCY